MKKTLTKKQLAILKQYQKLSNTLSTTITDLRTLMDDPIFTSIPEDRDSLELTTEQYDMLGSTYRDPRSLLQDLIDEEYWPPRIG